MVPMIEATPDNIVAVATRLQEEFGDHYSVCTCAIPRPKSGMLFTVDEPLQSDRQIKPLDSTWRHVLAGEIPAGTYQIIAHTHDSNGNGQGMDFITIIPGAGGPAFTVFVGSYGRKMIDWRGIKRPSRTAA